MNGIEYLRTVCSQVPFRGHLQSKIATETAFLVFRHLWDNEDIKNDPRTGWVTLPKVQKYLHLYSFIYTLEDKNPGPILRSIFGVGDRPLSNDERTCFAVMSCAACDVFEFYDGTGQPNHKRGDEIDPLARVLAAGIFIAERWIELKSAEEIAADLRAASGKKLAPKTAEAALLALDDLVAGEREWYDLYGAEDETAQLQLRPVVESSLYGTVAYDCRMILRDDGLSAVLPSVYIPIAEKNEKIADITLTHLGKVCRYLAKARIDRGIKPLPVWVTVSALCFDKKSFVKSLKKLLTDNRIAPELLILGIAESALAYDRISLGEVLPSLRELGVKVGLDSFGAEYSSLSVLGSVEVDYIRPDESFADSICENKKTFDILKSISALAGSMNVDILAAGVNDSERIGAFSRLSCQFMEGDAFGEWVSVGEASLDG